MESVAVPPPYQSAGVSQLVNFTDEVSAAVLLRGLPFHAKESDVRSFVGGFPIDDPDGVLVLAHGDRRGEAYVRFPSADVADEFLRARNRQHMGDRYVEIFPAYPEEMELALMEEVASGTHTRNPIVRLRGLPFSATDADIRLFFHSLEDSLVDVRIVVDGDGRATGDGFLELASEEAVPLALTKDRLLMGARYIEVTRSSAADREAVMHAASRRSRNHGSSQHASLNGGTAPSGKRGHSNVARSGGGGGPEFGFPLDGGMLNGGMPGGFLPFPAAMMHPMFGMMPMPMMMPPLPTPQLPLPLPLQPGPVSVQIGREAAEAASRNQQAQTYQALMMRTALFGPWMPPPPPGLGLPTAPLLPTNRKSAYPNAGPSELIGGGVTMNGQQPAAAASGPSRRQSRHIIRVRGLPFSASEATVAEFFHDVCIPPQGVHMVFNAQDRPTGEAFVEVESDADVVAALQHNGGALGHRYIEVFRSSPADMLRLGGGPPAAAMDAAFGLGVLPPSFTASLLEKQSTRSATEVDA